MLGPVDMEDWDRNEADDLRAEIRCLPVVLLFARDPGPTGRRIGKRLADSLQSLSQGADFSVSALLRLHAELKAADGKA
jgi:hypothetical protein